MTNVQFSRVTFFIVALILIFSETAYAAAVTPRIITTLPSEGVPDGDQPHGITIDVYNQGDIDAAGDKDNGIHFELRDDRLQFAGYGTMPAGTDIQWFEDNWPNPTRVSNDNNWKAKAVEVYFSDLAPYGNERKSFTFYVKRVKTGSSSIGVRAWLRKSGDASRTPYRDPSANTDSKDIWGQYYVKVYTIPEPDTTPPFISAPQPSVTYNSAIIGWVTDEPSTGAVEYGITTDYGSIISNSNYVTNHYITIPNLEPSTTYHYRVKSTDASGNTAATIFDFTFTISAAPVVTTPIEITPTSIPLLTPTPAQTQTPLPTIIPIETPVPTIAQSPTQPMPRKVNFNDMARLAEARITLYTYIGEVVVRPYTTDYIINNALEYIGKTGSTLLRIDLKLISDLAGIPNPGDSTEEISKTYAEAPIKAYIESQYPDVGAKLDLINSMLAFYNTFVEMNNFNSYMQSKSKEYFEKQHETCYESTWVYPDILKMSTLSKQEADFWKAGDLDGVRKILDEENSILLSFTSNKYPFASKQNDFESFEGCAMGFEPYSSAYDVVHDFITVKEPQRIETEYSFLKEAQGKVSKNEWVIEKAQEEVTAQKESENPVSVVVDTISSFFKTILKSFGF